MPSMMRRLTSGPKPSARLRRYIRTSGLSSWASRAVAGLFQLCPLGGQLGQHFLFVGAIAVVHAVVAGQVARGFAGGDDVIGGHGIFGVRQRNLLDLGPQRLIDAHRLAHGRFDFGVEPRAKMFADQAQPQTGQRLADRLACTAGTGRSTDVESSGSWPAITSSSSAASSAVRANGPIWSRLLAKATSPYG